MSKDNKNRVTIIGRAYYGEQFPWRDRLKAVLISAVASVLAVGGLIQLLF